MGNIEKLVVLIILLACAGALAVSLSDSEPLGTDALAAPLASRPLASHGAETGSAARQPVRGPASGATRSGSAGEELRRRGTVASLPEPDARRADRSQGRGIPLLDAAQVPVNRSRRNADSEPAETNSAGMPRILRSSRGLESSAVEEYKVYKPGSRDTWSGLAERFYRDARHAQSLRIANEGLDNLAKADFILVPVYDLAAEAGGRASLRPASRPTSPRDSGYRGNRTAGQTAIPSARRAQSLRGTAPEGGVEYIVIAGDTLSEISQRVYGTARRWREIYEANKDLLKSEHQLTLDMKLYIPKAGEVSVPARKAPAAEVQVQPTASTGKVR